MAGGLLGIGTSGLRAAQRSLSTTSHNIANVNTENYSRQRVTLLSSFPQFSGVGFLGTGVQIGDIRRVYDDFLNNQVRNSTSTFSEIDRFHTLASEVDNILADPDVGLSNVLRNFFNAVHEVADNPTFIPARQVLLSQADTLAARFQSLNRRFDDMRMQVNQGLDNTVSEINSLADSIAEINTRIVSELGRSQGDPPNDLLDQRDQLLAELSEKVDISIIEQGEGAINVFIGKGQALVLGNQSSELVVQTSPLDPFQKDIAFVGNNTNVIVTNSLTGGELGGAINFSREVLDSAQNGLGRIAAGVAIEFNNLHQTGYDLNGGTGNSFFNFPPTPTEIPVFSPTGTTGTVSAVYDLNAVDQFAASDYRLDRNGVNYSLTRLSDNSTTDLSALGFPAGSVTVDGITITEGITAIASGESFLLRPMRDVAGSIGVNITDPTEFAAAQSDTSSGSVGDNSNALALADLESAQRLLNGNASFQDAYTQIVAEVGTLTGEARTALSAQEGLLNRAIASREGLSGVNLDEEAANLISFQQAYQAAAQVITVANNVFDILIGAVRG